MKRLWLILLIIGCTVGPRILRYEGDLNEEGKWHGKGVITYSNGNKWEGEFKDGEPCNGYGVYFHPNGEKYVGEFKDGCPNGQGTEILPNSDNYSTPTKSVSIQRDEVYLLPPPKTPVFIAVIDLIGNNVSDNEVKALTDRLRVELFNTKHFKVVERAMMNEILEEQGLQQSGCTTTECIVEVGKLIGVEQIVGGSISKVGNTFSVSARIVSVVTGDILHTATYDYKGEIDDLLTTGMKKVAKDLTK